MSEINTDPQKTLQFNPEKCSELLGKLIDSFQEHKPTIGEILVIYGNLGYTLGASIEGHDSKGPDIETLKQEYYTNPTVGAALMLQGIEITNWFQDHELKTSDEERK